jgi:hypothetical protein
MYIEGRHRMDERPYTKVAFYVVAHADDWQLFMTPNAYHDLVAQDTKVVLITTTAGDAGKQSLYWGAREEGAKSSVRFCLAPLSALAQSTSVQQFNGHHIHRWSANSTSCYFLRLPDGGLDGGGFPAYHHQSLSKLRAGQIDAITAVDDSATYTGWSDFSTTLQAIVEAESSGIPNLWLNYPNPDTSANSNDHPDHIATGQAVQAMPLIAHVQQALFVGYSLKRVPASLSATDLFWKAGMFAAYEKAVLDSNEYSTLSEGIQTYLEWCLSSPLFITVDTPTARRSEA